VLTESRFFKGIILSATLLLLAACSSSPTSTTSSSGTPPMSASDAYQASRYDIQQDRASSQLLDPAQIREVIPMRETRTSAGNKSPYTVNGKTYRVMQSEQGYRERGFASWYGEKFHGHKTSNGEIYDMFQLSAAHKSMPLPGFVRVTNLENNRSIVVRVNDRGPFHSERIIDLSYAAAYMLGFDNKGTAMVEVEAIVPTLAATTESPRPPSPASLAPQQAGGGAILQVGAFSDLQAAQQLTMKLQEMTSRPVFIRSVEIGEERELIHRVRVGPIPSADEIGRITDSVVAADLGRPYTVRE
jgi:rare lipoprotein A